jgi:hypothetical protein
MEVEQTSSAAAGWFNDPSGEPQLRYWDGTQWTNHVHPLAPPASVAPSGTGNGHTATPPVAEVEQVGPTPVTTAEAAEALSEKQVAYLTEQLQFGALVKRAFGWAAMAPLIVAALGAGLVRLTLYIPLFGWVFALWGIVGTIAAVLATGIAIPLLALVLLPVVLLVKRPRLRQDLESGKAIRQRGTFVVEDPKVGMAQLRTGSGKSFDLTSGQLAKLVDVLPASGDVHVLTGSLVKTVETSLILGLYDESGRELLAAS